MSSAVKVSDVTLSKPHHNWLKKIVDFTMFTIWKQFGDQMYLRGSNVAFHDCRYVLYLSEYETENE